MKRLLLILIFAAALRAQTPVIGAGSIDTVTADPSGSCQPGQNLQYNSGNGKLWGCDGGTWTQIGSGGGGGGAFTDLTSGTNTTAAMVVGTGASLAATGSGTIVATDTVDVNGAAVPASAGLLYTNSSKQFAASTTATTDGSEITFTKDALDSTLYQIISLVNTTAATSMQDQNAPGVYWAENYWSADDSMSHLAEFSIHGGPAGALVFDTQDSSGGWNAAFSINSQGGFNIASLTVSESAQFTAGAIALGGDNLIIIGLPDGFMGFYTITLPPAASPAAGYVLASTDDASTLDWSISSRAQLAFTSLGTPDNGSQVYCTDCTVTGALDNTCAGSGSGAIALRIAGAWKCVQ